MDTTHLMRKTSIVLQDVVILCALGQRDLLGDWHGVCEVLVGEFVQLLRVIWITGDETDAREIVKSRTFRDHQSVALGQWPYVQEREPSLRLGRGRSYTFRTELTTTRSRRACSWVSRL